MYYFNFITQFFLLWFIIFFMASCSPADNPPDASLICDPNIATVKEGLKITEVGATWIEIFNSSSGTICLSDYHLRTYTNKSSRIHSFQIPNFLLPSKSYSIISFAEVQPKVNMSKNMIFMYGIEKKISSQTKLYYELLINNKTKTMDVFKTCLAGSITTITPNQFDGCVASSSPNTSITWGKSFTRDKDNTDNNSFNDWSFSTMVTVGGPNDLTDDLSDEDKDGIPDANEVAGSTFIGMPLYEWGARKNQKDIFIHIDYMAGWERNEGLNPRRDSLEKISNVFNKNGYTVHFDVGEKYGINKFNLSNISHEVPFVKYTDINPKAVSTLATPGAVSILKYKYKYMPINRLRLFHYVLFANNLSSSGKNLKGVNGVAEVPGNDVLIILGEKGINEVNDIFKKNFIASTLFHELGHNLGLYHGGKVDVNNKPNFFSSMNYMYAYKGLPTTNDSDPQNFYNRYLRTKGINVSFANGIETENFEMDYSHGAFVNHPFNENSFSEIKPLGDGLGDIDWNHDGQISNGTFNGDINGDGSKGILKDFDEWKLVKLDHYSVNYWAGNLAVDIKHDPVIDDANTPVVVCTFPSPFIK